MDTQKTLAKDLVDHWDSAAAKGLMTKAIAATLATSCRHVLGVDPDWETLDVQTLDVEKCVRRFNNLRSGAYKPRSLQDYGSRFRRAVASYLSYLEDPAGWRFVSRHRSASRSDGSVSARPPATGHGDHGLSATKEHHGVSLQEYLFPIRQDLMAKLAIPRDVKTAEINRLVAWVRTLAVDYEPSK